MKKFIISIISVAVFFVGLGSLVEKAGAKFKSDEKALEIVRRSRIAIGGDAAIAEIRGMIIKGQTTRQVNINGTERSEPGETEIALQLPDRMMKVIKIGDGSGEGEPLITKNIDVVVVGGDKSGMKVRSDGGEKAMTKVIVNEEDTGAGPVRKIVIKKADGTVQELTGAEADKMIAEHGAPNDGVRKIFIKKADGSTGEVVAGTAHKSTFHKIDDGNFTFTSKDGEMRRNELLRTTLSLLMTAPTGIDVEYTYGGDASIDGTLCDVVNASFGGSAYKLYISRSSSLPIAMGYKGHRMPQVINVTHTEPIETANAKKDIVLFTKTLDSSDGQTDFIVKFSDYRSTGAVQLPYKWTTTVADKNEDTFDVTSYEINPANLADRFKDQKVMIRVKKPETK